MPKANRVHSTPRRTASKTKPKSAIIPVLKSGLDLVPTRKTRGKHATMSDYAKVDFKPWKREPHMKEDELFPSNEKMAELGVTCRIAYGVMLRTREQLIEAHGKLHLAAIEQMMSRLPEAAETLKAIAHMVEIADLRFLASAAAAYKQGVKFKGVDDKPARRKAVAS